MINLALNEGSKLRFANDKCLFYFQTEFHVVSVKSKIILLALDTPLPLYSFVLTSLC